MASLALSVAASRTTLSPASEWPLHDFILPPAYTLGPLIAAGTRLPTCNLLQRLPSALPGLGIGEEEARTLVGDAKRERSARLGDPHVLAHMDPPTPEIAAEWIGLKASVNQNLLHPDLSPFATEAERRVIAWLAPFFGMAEGHMCAGSTIANLAALWCAREHGASRVVASADAHLSVPKAAHLLGMPFEALPVDQVLPALGETAPHDDQWRAMDPSRGGKPSCGSPCRVGTD